MKTIYKYPLEITDTQIVLLPLEAVILTAQVQNGQLCLWAEVDPNIFHETRRFWIIGTGNPIPDIDLDYIASVQMGMFVWHVYEAK